MLKINQLKKIPHSNWNLFAVTFINRMGSVVVPFMTLYLNKEQGLSASQAGVIVSFYGLASLLGSIVSGKLCDKFHSKHVIGLSLLLSPLAMGALYSANGFITICVVAAFLGFVFEMFRPASSTYIARTCPKHEHRIAYSLNRLAVNLGMAIGPLCAGYFLQGDFKKIFILNAGASLLAFFVSFFLPKGIHHKDSGEQFKKVSLFKDWLLWGFYFTCLPVVMIYFLHETTEALFLTNSLKLPPTVFGSIFTINALLIIFFEVPLNLATHKWPLSRTLSTGAALLGLGFGSLSFVKTAIGVQLSTAIWTFGEMILFPGLSAYITRIAPSHMVGRYLGIFGTLWGCAYIFGPLLGNLSLEKFGPTPLWLGCFVISTIVAAVFAVRLRDA